MLTAIKKIIIRHLLFFMLPFHLAWILNFIELQTHFNFYIRAYRHYKYKELSAFKFSDGTNPPSCSARPASPWTWFPTTGPCLDKEFCWTKHLFNCLSCYTLTKPSICTYKKRSNRKLFSSAGANPIKNLHLRTNFQTCPKAW